MDYLTEHYKNKCEKLSLQKKYLIKFITEKEDPLLDRFQVDQATQAPFEINPQHFNPLAWMTRIDPAGTTWTASMQAQWAEFMSLLRGLSAGTVTLATVAAFLASLGLVGYTFYQLWTNFPDLIRQYTDQGSQNTNTNQDPFSSWYGTDPLTGLPLSINNSNR